MLIVEQQQSEPFAARDQSELGKLKRKYHQICKENSKSQHTTPATNEAGDSGTMQAEFGTSTTSASNYMHVSAPSSDVNSAESKFKGKLVDTLFIIEICAGTARLSRTAQNMGFKVMAVDHSSKRSCGMPIQCFELEDPTQVEALADFIATEHCNIAYVWMAPSCGTASRAREKKHAKLEKMGHVLPGPLRSMTQPDQLDGLAGVDKIKTEKANMLYDAITVLALVCDAHGVAFAIENPANSRYWGTTPMQSLKGKVSHHFVNFQNCCHGGERDKLTSLMVNNNWLDSLEASCNKQHVHKPWMPTVQSNKLHFATSQEAAYPWLLCERILHAIRIAVEHRGASFHVTLQQQFLDEDHATTQRLVQGALPRGMKLKPLVAEFIDYTYAMVNPQCTAFLDAHIASLPKGARITSRQLGTGEKMRDETMKRLHDKTLVVENFAGDFFFFLHSRTSTKHSRSTFGCFESNIEC